MATPNDTAALLEHADFVRALARALVFDESLARDVEQQAWLAALESAPREVDSPRAWLATIVRNAARRAFRAEGRRESREHAVARAEASVPTPEEILAREDLRRSVVEALVALDEPWRSTLLLRYFENLSPRQIAQRLRVPLETVRARQKRGLELLRQRMEREHGTSRGAWAVALVRGLRLEPRWHARTLLHGAWILSSTHKVATAAAAIVVGLAALWIWQHAQAPAARAANATTALAELAPIAHGDQRVEDSVLERAETLAATDAPSAPPSDVDARYGSLLLRVVWADDQTPAPGVGMRLLLEHASDYYHHVLEVHSAADGTVRLDRILAGEVHAQIDRGWTKTCRVEPRAHAEATIELPSGVTVAGTVLDVDGRPFAGAELFVSLWGGSFDGLVVGHSRDDGSFELRGVRPHVRISLSAHASGRAPTRQCVVMGEDGAQLTARLQFESYGSALAGRVRDSRGEPVANARVLAGSDAYPEFEQSPDGVVTTRPAARCVRTDAQGEFRFDGLVAGRLPVQVRSTEHAPWSGEVELVESLASSLDIALIDGAVLTGFVRKASGEPVEGAEVWYGEPQSFVATVCTTDADGTYALRGLPPGELAIDVDAGSEGKAHAQLFAAAGATLRWDAVLSAGLVLRGRVVAPGRELDGWMVAAQTMGARSERWFVGTSMDSDGRFYIDDCPDRPLRVVLSHQDSGWLARAIVEGVRAGGAELVLEPDPALEPSVHLRGRIVDADGQPLPGAWFRPCHAKQDGQPLLAADVDGRFELGPYPPGEWTIRVQAGNLCSNSPTHAFAAGETWDFGDVHAELGGQVLVELDGACGAPGAATSVRMFDDTGWSEYLTVEGDRARSLINAAGRYTLSVEREGCGRLEREIEVRSGEETRVVVELSSK